MEDLEKGGFVEISADGIQAQDSDKNNTFIVRANGDAFFEGNLTSESGRIAG
jgi:hypothetical protein